MSAVETKGNSAAAPSPAPKASTPAGASNRKTSANSETSKSSPALSPADKLAKFKKFEGEGVTFKAKLVGSELVMEPRGDKMCQNSIQRLKAIIKGQKAHKRRIVMKISYEGVRVSDEKTSEVLFQHGVPQISFIASDDSDSRTFGYVCDVPNKTHQFICFKTAGPALQVMSEIRLLFEAMLERKEQKDEGAAQEPADKTSQRDTSATSSMDENANSKSAASANKENNNCDEFGFGPDLDDFCAEPIGQAAATSFQRQQSKQSADLDDLKDLDLGGAGATRLEDSSPAAVIGRGGSTTAGDSGILDLTFSDWVPSPQYSQPQPYPQAHQQAHQHQPEMHQRQPTAPAAIPITRGQRPATLNFTSSSFSGARFGPRMLSSTTPSAGLVGAATMDSSAATQGAHNRSLIYNHSSVSLNDAALSNRGGGSGSSQASPLAATNYNSLGPIAHQESTDKYAVFNDIEALPSIFESISSLNSSTTKLSNADQPAFFGGAPLPSQAHQAYAAPLGSQSMDLRQYHHNLLPHHQQQQMSAAGFPLNQQQMLNQSQNQFTLSFGNGQPAQQYQAVSQAPQLQQGSVVPSGSMAAAAGLVPRQMSNPFDDDFFA